MRDPIAWGDKQEAFIACQYHGFPLTSSNRWLLMDSPSKNPQLHCSLSSLLPVRASTTLQHSQQLSRQWRNHCNQGKLIVISSGQANRTRPSRFAKCSPLFNTLGEKKRPPSSLPSSTWILLQSHLQQTDFLRFTKGSQLIILWLQWTQSCKDCQASLGWITFQWFTKGTNVVLTFTLQRW